MPTRRILWRQFLTAMVALLVLAGVSGCSTPHTIIMTDGSTIETRNEPKLNRRAGFYEFKNASGKETRVNKDQIQRIEKSR